MSRRTSLAGNTAASGAGRSGAGPGRNRARFTVLNIPGPGRAPKTAECQRAWQGNASERLHEHGRRHETAKLTTSALRSASYQQALGNGEGCLSPNRGPHRMIKESKATTAMRHACYIAGDGHTAFSICSVWLPRRQPRRLYPWSCPSDRGYRAPQLVGQ